MYYSVLFYYRIIQSLDCSVILSNKKFIYLNAMPGKIKLAMHGK